MSTSDAGHSAELEKASGRQIQHAVTPGGNPVDFSVTPMPNQHRRIGNPAPLGLISFGCGFFIVSAFTLGAQGVTIPNVMVPVLILYGGLFQSITGLVELFTGNTFGGAVFCSYGAFNFTYGALYLPAFGVLEAYTVDGELSPQFGQAIGIYLMAWMMVTAIFIIGALRTNLAVLSTLVFTFLAFLCLGAGQMSGVANFALAGGSFGMCASLCAWWAAVCAFWSKDTTYSFFTPSPISLAG